MPDLKICEACGRHRMASKACCPHCGSCARSGKTRAAALMGLALMSGACTDGELEGTAEPDYGVPAYGDSGDTADTASPESE